MHMLKSYAWLLAFQWLVATALAQTMKAPAPKQMEADLYTTYSRVLYFDKMHNFDSLSLKSEEFSEKFLQYVSKNPSTMAYSFSKLTTNRYCGISYSDDEMLKIYSWDTWTGGTMRFFKSLFQYKIGEKTNVYSNDAEDGFFYSKIFTLKIGSQTIYLTLGNAIYSTRDIAQAVQAWQVQGDKLVPAKIFKTKSNNILSQIKVNCDFTSVSNRPERPIDLIFYDKNKQAIKVSVVDTKGAVMNDRFIIYKLNNNLLEYSGVEKVK